MELKHQVGGYILDVKLRQVSKIIKVSEASDGFRIYQLHLNNRSPTSWYSLAELNKFYPYLSTTSAVEVLYGRNQT